MFNLTCIKKAIGIAILFIAFASHAQANQIVVFAAASLKEAIDEVSQNFTASTGIGVTTSYAGSSALARQIEYGAPADVFISASPDWMDQLEAGGSIIADTRFDLLSNRLVLIAAPDISAAPMTVSPELDLPALLNGGRLAMAMTEAVPAGIYGKAALNTLGLWTEIAPMVAQTDNVRAALALVALRAAPVGLVYKTDAIADKRVKEIGVFPVLSHPAIVYPAAATKRANQENAAAFLDYLRSDTAHRVFEKLGFIVIEHKEN